MSDDTTTWLKKNPVINPMRRSLKNSFRFHVPNSEMDSSIISNPDRGKDQQLFIPKMMQRTSMRVLKLKSHEFKVPEPVAKSSAKKTIHGSGSRLNNSGTKVKSKNLSVPVRKSFLPVPRTQQTQGTAKGPTNEPTLIGLKKSFGPGGSARKSLARRSLLQKMVALSELSRNGTNQPPRANSETDSVPRSILKKKRNSLRRLSQSSGKEKPKGAKKVLFDVFESSELEDKENEEMESSSSVRKEIEKGDNEFMALDEPTVFLNFRNPDNEEETQQAEGQQQHQQTQDDSQLTTASTSNSPTTTTNNINSIVQIWKSYRENVKNLEVMRGSLENSFDSFFEHSIALRDEYNSYKKNAHEIYETLSKLAEDLEGTLTRTIAGEGSPSDGDSKSKRKSPGRRSLEKAGKIRLSDRSKAIKKNSGKKSLSSVKKGMMMEESFGSVGERKGLF